MVNLQQLEMEMPIGSAQWDQNVVFRGSRLQLYRIRPIVTQRAGTGGTTLLLCGGLARAELVRQMVPVFVPSKRRSTNMGSCELEKDDRGVL